MYLYYRRNGQREPLPGPEGSVAFLLAYEKAREKFEVLSSRSSGQHTVADGITTYLESADYRQLGAGTRRDYRRVLDRFRGPFGHLPLSTIDEAWIEELRDKYAPDQGRDGDPIGWNRLRTCMTAVIRTYRRRHPNVLPANHWETSRRLKVEESDANRPWPPGVLAAVMQGATMEFRCLLVGYLLTAQRGGDATAWTPDQWDRDSMTLRFRQQKTARPLVLHVPPSLGRAFSEMEGRHPRRLLVTPRGRAWTTANAQETLATLLRSLGLPRYTLHGLRATGPVALKMLGFENRAIRELTGHDSDANLEVCLRGVASYPLAKQAQEALAGAFDGIIEKAFEEGNRRRFAGVTGRAARKAKGGPGNAQGS